VAYRTTALRIDRDQELRERIIVAALARVTEGGFAALTMQALAEDVGIATGSLYRHVRNKGDLAAEVFAQASQREVDTLALTMRGPGSPVQRLVAGWPSP
jgi:AcrR family transcriptional regulator